MKSILFLLQVYITHEKKHGEHDMENLVMRNTAEKLQTADEVWQKIESNEDVSL